MLYALRGRALTCTTALYPKAARPSQGVSSTRTHHVKRNNTSFARPAAVGNVAVADETMEDKLARAKGYPYPRPDTSFLFIDGDVFEFHNSDWRGMEGMHELKGTCGTSAAAFASARGVDLAPAARPDLYTPVLAIGSNAGPEQLRRKYPRDAFPGCLVPVIQVDLPDFDVVYTPYLSTYGSCTATLEHSPGTTVRIFITYLTERLMRRMHETEGGYNLCRLGGLQLRVAPHGGSSAGGGGSGFGGGGSAAHPQQQHHHHPHHSVRDWVYQYNHRQGALALPLVGRAASPIAIRDIPATGRAFPAATQPHMLALLRAALGEDADGDADGEEAGNGDGGGAAARPLRPVHPPGTPTGCGEAGASAAAGDAGLDAWILRNIHTAAARTAAVRRLELHAQPFAYPHTELVVDLGAD